MPGPALTILAGNRLEALLGAVARTIAGEPLPPLARELIVVPSAGMRRWVTLGLARALGCAASLELPLPARFCRAAAALAVGATVPADEEDPWQRTTLAWRILAALEPALADPRYAALAAYCAGADQRMRHQLAERVAGVFADYQHYRPDLLRSWEGGRLATGHAHEPWQADLWRRLVEAEPAPHLARLVGDAVARLEAGTQRAVPPRVTVFAVGSLPPPFVDLLRALALRTAVAIHVAAPTPEFWGDLRSPREIRRARRRAGAGGSAEAAEDDHFATGNALLAGLGRQGRDAFNLLVAADPAGQGWEACGFVPPGTATALATLQDDIFAVRERGADDDAPPLPLADHDRSLSLHACHSPRRELEVVRDQLLAAFAEDPTLAPADVLVLVTDLARYAPFAAAVLGGRHDGIELPVRIADRPLDERDPYARAVLALLRLPDGRAGATGILDLLEAQPLRAAAGIDADAVAGLRARVAEAGVRWGLDAAHRSGFGLPQLADHTWRAGLDRLVLGAATGEDDGLIAGILPLAGDTGGDAELIGRLAVWIARLRTRLERLRRAQPLADWAETLVDLVDGLLVADDDGAEALAALRQRLAGLADLGARSGCDLPVELAVVRDHLAAAFAEDADGGAFPWGGITVAALRPMRTIPFRVIAVCGLDDQAFPRRAQPPAFDLAAAAPRPGDRSLRDEDRQLFLETLLAARGRLVLTWVGRSQVDNAPLPPSVCVAELLDACDRTFTVPGGTARDRLLIRHRLQPSDPAYFDGRDPRLASFAAAACAPRGEARPAPFCPAPLPAAADAVELDWADLAEAWVNPCRHFCHSLGIALRPAEELGEDCEPAGLAGLARHAARERLVARRLAGRRDGEVELLAAAGLLPPGALGAAAARAVIAEVDAFLARLGTPPATTALAIETGGEDWRLVGTVDGAHAGGVLRWRCADARPADHLRAWFAHLAVNATRAGRGEPPLPTRLVAADGAWDFAVPDDPAGLLADLVAGERAARRAPQPLFPLAGCAFAEQRLALARGGRARADPLAKAAAAYHGSTFARGRCDADDPWIALCFAGQDPFAQRADDFAALAEALWDPLLAARTEVE